MQKQWEVKLDEAYKDSILHRYSSTEPSQKLSPLPFPTPRNVVIFNYHEYMGNVQSSRKA